MKPIGFHVRRSAATILTAAFKLEDSEVATVEKEFGSGALSAREI
jgi:hypothetical protein